jgi:hypothetical protein
MVTVRFQNNIPTIWQNSLFAQMETGRTMDQSMDSAHPGALPSTCPAGRVGLPLEVTGVRVEQLQGISYEDAKAEGVESAVKEHFDLRDQRMSIHGHAFAHLWESINRTWLMGHKPLGLGDRVQEAPLTLAEVNALMDEDSLKYGERFQDLPKESWVNKWAPMNGIKPFRVLRNRWFLVQLFRESRHGSNYGESSSTGKRLVVGKTE